MFDISTVGLTLRLVASQVFPNGITISQFPDDADAFTVEDVDVATTELGQNNDMIVRRRAETIKAAVSVIPGSPDDRNLGALLSANRARAGASQAADAITITYSYPDGSGGVLVGGAIEGGPVGFSATQAGGKASKTYRFGFKDHQEL